jgi:hypothetical protein
MSNLFEFVQIPFAPNYAANRAGQIIEIATGIFYPNRYQALRNGTRIRVFITDTAPGYLYIAVKKIIAMMFVESIYPIDDIKTMTQLVIPIDGNEDNLQVNNLKWITLKELRGIARDKFFEERKKKYPLPNLDNCNTGFYPNAIECSQKPGFFHVPFPNVWIVVDRTGTVYDLLSGCFVPFKYMDGYPYVQIYAGTKSRRQIAVHRLVAMLFCEIPDRHKNKAIDELEVNHLDFDRRNANYQNLEWCTPIENFQHMLAAGRSERQTPVLVKEIETGEIRRYVSASACAEAEVIEPYGLRRHLNSNCAGMVEDEGRLFKKDDGRPWPNCTAVNADHAGLFFNYDIVAENIDTGEKHLCLNLKHASNVLRLSYNGLTKYRMRYGNSKPYCSWIFYSLNDISK